MNLLTRNELKAIIGGHKDDATLEPGAATCWAHCDNDEDVRVADCERATAEKACGGTAPAAGCTCA